MIFAWKIVTQCLSIPGVLLTIYWAVLLFSRWKNACSSAQIPNVRKAQVFAPSDVLSLSQVPVLTREPYISDYGRKYAS